jgi:hypothetical protein
VSNAIGKEIYLDRDQCERFGVTYGEDGETLACAASAILGSKDYDKAHKDLLRPLGGATVVAEQFSFGWFRITRVVV